MAYLQVHHDSWNEYQQNSSVLFVLIAGVIMTKSTYCSACVMYKKLLDDPRMPL